MRLCDFIKKYLFFGLGVVFGATVATTVTYIVLSACYGLPEIADVLEIRECLEEKINEGRKEE
jgi:hypothetical protein|tara:strand:- start:264 stop:452 length:189 start_codon:yes stop_codon:yes gene_type:complete